MGDNRDFVLPVNILTLLVHARVFLCRTAHYIATVYACLDSAGSVICNYASNYAIVYSL